MAQPRIIPDRAEFVDALTVLRRGHVLVHLHDGAGGCLLDGAALYRSFRVLDDYGLIDRFDNAEGFPNVDYYRLSPRGRDFADRACSAWRRRPLLARLAVRVTG